MVPSSPAAWTMPANGGSSAETVVNRPRNVVRIGDIGSNDADFAALLFAEFVNPLPCGVGWRATAGQHQMLGAVRGQVSGDFQPDRSQPARHQIRCVSA